VEAGLATSTIFLPERRLLFPPGPFRPRCPYFSFTPCRPYSRSRDAATFFRPLLRLVALCVPPTPSSFQSLSLACHLRLAVLPLSVTTRP